MLIEKENTIEGNKIYFSITDFIDEGALKNNCDRSLQGTSVWGGHATPGDMAQAAWTTTPWKQGPGEAS